MIVNAAQSYCCCNVLLLCTVVKQCAALQLSAVLQHMRVDVLYLMCYCSCVLCLLHGDDAQRSRFMLVLLQLWWRCTAMLVLHVLASQCAFCVSYDSMVSHTALLLHVRAAACDCCGDAYD